MEAEKIMNADLLDILFDGKNKAYGAYELRKTYNRRVIAAVISMSFVCLLFLLSQIFANGNGNGSNRPRMTEVILKPTSDVTKPEPPPVRPPKVNPPKAATTQFVVPLIVKDKDVQAPLPDIETLDQTQIALINQAGDKNVDFVAPLVEQTTDNTVVLKTRVEEYEKLFTKIEKEAQFPGGPEAWKRYLERHLNAGVAADEGAAQGSYTVRVEFVVDKEGGISNVQAVEVPAACPGCGPEAVRVIKNGPHWEPAVQNGGNVTYKAVQLVTFEVAE